jgi:SAM-dependent methyltransferase
MGRVKGVSVSLLADTQVWALLETHLHTDFASCVLSAKRRQTGRGKPIVLQQARLTSLDQALLAQQAASGQQQQSPPPGVVPIRSLAHLQEVAVRLYAREQEVGRESDGACVGRYYDERASQYDEHNGFSQERLTRRVLELAGWLGASGPRQPACVAIAAAAPPPRPTTPPSLPSQIPKPCLLLDIGSGTGLSSAAARALLLGGDSDGESGRLRTSVVGVDVSLGMLARRGRGRDEGACAADVGGSRLPFRSGCFDGAISISAVHYLCRDLPAQQLTGRQRAERLFREAHRVVGGDDAGVFCAQFHPDQPSDAALLLEAAVAAGWSRHASALVVDQTHHTDARRWYIVCRRAAACSAPPRTTSTSGVAHQQQQQQQQQPPRPPPRCCCRMYSTAVGVNVQCVLIARDGSGSSGDGDGGGDGGGVASSPRAATSTSPSSSSSSSCSMYLDHLEWVTHAHVKYARTLIRRLNYEDQARTTADDAVATMSTAPPPVPLRKKPRRAAPGGRRKRGGGDEPSRGGGHRAPLMMGRADRELAQILRVRFGAGVTLQALEERRAEVLQLMHRTA